MKTVSTRILLLLALQSVHAFAGGKLTWRFGICKLTGPWPLAKLPGEVRVVS